jgi:hypothetical protein
VNIVRNSESDEIENITFDITNNQFADSIIDSITTRILESILFPNSTNQNTDTLSYDASNNTILYETIIRPNTNNR